MPTRNIIGLLVHVQYAPTVREVLAKHGIQPKDFNPTDPIHITDPKYDTLSASDRQLLANTIHANRLLRTLQHMRALRCQTPLVDKVSTNDGRHLSNLLQRYQAAAQSQSFLPDGPRHSQAEQSTNNCPEATRYLH
jgi:hypothetical protein